MIIGLVVGWGGLYLNFEVNASPLKIALFLHTKKPPLLGRGFTRLSFGHSSPLSVLYLLWVENQTFENIHG